MRKKTLSCRANASSDEGREAWGLESGKGDVRAQSNSVSNLGNDAIVVAVAVVAVAVVDVAVIAAGT